MLVSTLVAVALLSNRQASSIVSHPKLQGKLGVEFVLSPVPEALKTLSEKTGIELKVIGPMFDLKLDIYAENEPIGVVLEKIAETLGGEWESNKTGFVLTQSATKQNNERFYLQLEEDYARRNADFEIDVCRRIAQLIPPSDQLRIDPSTLAFWKEQKLNGIAGGGDTNFFEDFIPARDNARREVEGALKQGQSLDQVRHLRIELEALTRIAKGDPPLIKSRLISKMTAKELDSYRSGVPFACSTEGKSRFKISPGDQVGSFVVYKQGEPQPAKAYGLTQIVPDTFELAYVEYTYGEGSSGISGGANKTAPVRGIPVELESHPFIKDLRTWEQNTAVQSLFLEPLKPDNAKPTASPYYVKGFRFGDHLRWLHKASGLPVVVMSDRRIHPWAKVERQFRTAGDYLAAIEKVGGGHFRRSSNFLLARNGQFWRNRKNEIPESWYARLESRQKSDYLAYCRAAVPLTRIQGMLLASRQGFLTRFDPTPYQGSMLALKMVGVLTDTQLAQALRPGGLSINDMSLSQRQQVQSTIIQSVLNGTFVQPEFLVEIIDRALDPKVYEGVSFSIIPNSKSSMMVGATRLEDGETEIQPQTDYKDILMTDFVFWRNGTQLMRFHGYGV